MDIFDTKNMTAADIKDEIKTLKRGLEIRKNYLPNNPVVLMIKRRLKVLEKREK